VSNGQISVGELTSLLMYTLYVGSGLQMLTYVHLTMLFNNCPPDHAFQILLREPIFLKVSGRLTGASPDIYNAWNWRRDTYL
jgi:putative ABC transport system ATP-binding protein